MSQSYFTQGSILEGVRSERYPGCPCYGIVITANCDIANCKAPRIYYLTAMNVDDWLKTEGLLNAVRNRLANDYKQFIEEFKGRIPGLSDYENAAVINLEAIILWIEDLPNVEEPDEKKEDEDKKEPFHVTRTKALKRLNGIKKFSVEEDETQKLESMYNDLRSSCYSTLLKVIADSNTQYCFMPRVAYLTEWEKEAQKSKKSHEAKKVHEDGMIVCLQDVNFWTTDTVGKIEKKMMDYDKLSPKDREEYNEQFFLEKPRDSVFPERKLELPYIHKLMQDFSHAFTRIGLEFDSNAAKDHWTKMKKEGNNK